MMVHMERYNRTYGWLQLVGFSVALFLGMMSLAPTMPSAVVAAQAVAADELAEQAEAAFLARRTYADGERAVQLFERVLAAQPNDVSGLLRLAELHYWLGEMIEDGEALPVLERGLTFAQQATEVAEDNADAHYWFGVLTGRIGEERGILQSLFMVKDIMAAIDRALELNSEHAGAHMLASQVYRKAPGWPLSIGDRKKAIEHGLEAVRLDPHKTIHVLNLAEAYLNDRQQDKARELLQQVLDMPLTPGDEVISQREKERAAQLLAELR